jgi:hypothetical protein
MRGRYVSIPEYARGCQTRVRDALQRRRLLIGLFARIVGHDVFPPFLNLVVEKRIANAAIQATSSSW